MAVISARPRHTRLRWGLLGGVAFTTLLVGYGLLRYPAILTITDGALALIAMAITLALYTGITLYGTGALTKIDQQMAQPGSGVGLCIGFLWMIELLSGSLGDLTNPFISLLYRGSTLLVILAALLAGVFASKRSGLIRSACLLGLWSGLICGVITTSTVLLMTYLCMNILQYNTQNVQEFLRNPLGAPDITIFLAREIIVSGISHLLLGPIFAIVIGGFGGLLGKGLHISECR